MIRSISTPLDHQISAEQELGTQILGKKYGIRRPNKAHTATAHRVARRFQTEFNEGDGFDIQTDDIIVEVETTATMFDSAARLAREQGPVYIALTNKDGVADALRSIPNLRVGIMDAHGNIVRESQNPC